jgi:hypothetical protein
MNQQPIHARMDAALRLGWIARLIRAGSSEAVAALVIERVEAEPDAVSARMIWHEAGNARGSHGTPTHADMLRMQELLRDEAELREDGDCVSLRLLPDLAAALLIEVDAGATAATLQAALSVDLELAGHQWRQLQTLAELHDSHRQLERSENLQRALFAIADLAGGELEMSAMLQGIHAIVSTL